MEALDISLTSLFISSSVLSQYSSVLIISPVILDLIWQRQQYSSSHEPRNRQRIITGSSFFMIVKLRKLKLSVGVSVRKKVKVLAPAHTLTLFMSGWQDSNLRPPGPKPGTLTNCATPRFVLRSPEDSGRRRTSK